MKVVVPMAAGFEEIEFSCIVDILRRAGLEVVTAGLKDGLIEGAHGVRAMADISLDQVKADDFDAIVLPGGSPGFINLGQDERVFSLLREMDRAGKYITAICGGPSVLSRAGVLKGRKATIYPGLEGMLAGAESVSDRVVVDGNLVTSRGPGTAMEFALKLVEIMEGEDAMEEVKEGLVI
ncbi:MAG: DJ-1/PfpI family protein [Dehalococcoidia bacterium]|nr:DJ-1/PfpI family protein [Dehalococcoidia bacterium]